MASLRRECQSRFSLARSRGDHRLPAAAAVNRSSGPPCREGSYSQNGRAPVDDETVPAVVAPKLLVILPVDLPGLGLAVGVFVPRETGASRRRWTIHKLDSRTRVTTSGRTRRGRSGARMSLLLDGLEIFLDYFKFLMVYVEVGSNMISVFAFFLTKWANVLHDHRFSVEENRFSFSLLRMLE